MAKNPPKTPKTPAPPPTPPSPPRPPAPAPAPATTPAPAPATTPSSTPAPTGATGLSEAQIRAIIQNQINSMKIVTQDNIRGIVSNQITAAITENTFTKKEINDRFTTKAEVREVVESVGFTKKEASDRFTTKAEVRQVIENISITKDDANKRFIDRNELNVKLDNWWKGKNSSNWVTGPELDKWWNNKNPSRWVTQSELSDAIKGIKGGGGKVTADDVKGVLDEVMGSNKFKANLANIFDVNQNNLKIKDFIKEGLFSYYGASKNAEDQNEIKDLLKTIKTIRDDLETLSEFGVNAGEQGSEEGTYDVAPEGETTLDAVFNIPVTTRSAGGGVLSKIKIPPPNTNPADITYPSNAQPIFMPNINTRVKVEIDRITMSLVKTAKEFLEAGIDFNAINYVPGSQIVDAENGLVYYDPTELNTPGNPTSSFASEVINGIVDELIKLLNYGDRANNQFNYYEYLNLFDLTYDNNGNPSYVLNVEIEDVIIDNLKAIKVNEDNNNASVNPERALEGI